MDSIRVARVENVLLERPIPPTTPDGTPTRQRLDGTLHLTPHHLIFSPTPDDPSSSRSPSQPEEIWVPYPSITLLTRLPQGIQGLYPLQIRTRTFDSYVFLFPKAMEGGAEDVWQSVKDCAVASSVEQLYAFFYSLPPPDPSGWGTFNPRAEFARQGVGSRTKAWRFTDINKDYSFCPTYPSKLVVPSRISDSTLVYAGKYRSKARIPALTYLHWANQASITRSSQPMVGLKNSRSAQDERLVECIFSSHLSAENAYFQTAPDPLSSVQTSPSSAIASLPPIYGSTSTNLIIDARPTTNAMANVAMGAGTENMDNYRTGKKAYLGIDNIHVMRNSLRTIAEAIVESEMTSTPIDRGLLRKSNWLRHISTLLDGALVIVRNIHLNASHVLIHCSDGWDRTSQLSAVAQICLDPYYRTLHGFKVLIEKDWLAFGHKFLDRSGHLSSEKLFTVTDVLDDESDEEAPNGAQRAAQAFFASVQKQFASKSHLKEISPVFAQFLECVYQIMRQYPKRFEFNENLLLDIHYHLYACQFGTFLFNNERDRRVPISGKPYVNRTVSAWDWFDRPKQQEGYLNSEYDPKLDESTSRENSADQGVLMPDPKDVKFWFRLFRRGDEEMNGSKLALQQAPGADMLGPVGAGQPDPISIEGVISGLSISTSDNIISTRSSTNPSPAPPESRSVPNLMEEERKKDTFRPYSTSSAFSLQPHGRQSQTQNTSTGGWNWGQLSQISSGALNVIQGAAREIKNISQDALSQIRAEGNADGETWERVDAASQYPAPGLPAPRLPTSLAQGGLRIPSETNPWSTETTMKREPSPVNPWGNKLGQSISTSELSGKEVGAGIGDEGKMGKDEDKVIVEAAMGGERKAWDPLGAL
ncbi:myotubularin [Tremella mesenterica]|uniref:Myotubularin n=1 Tax=Tremella mesenterica TaxID=5217 RepID=A0A4V1M3F5_TREME|nr:myotubularin [Tremella mesenterica]